MLSEPPPPATPTCEAPPYPPPDPQRDGLGLNRRLRSFLVFATPTGLHVDDILRYFFIDLGYVL